MDGETKFARINNDVGEGRHVSRAPWQVDCDLADQALPSSFVFREPVDPVLLGIPTYFQVIPKKDARDLRTIRTRLDNDKYDSTEAFEADLDLMIRNAITFNGADSEVGKISFVVQDRIKDMLNNIKSGGGTKKRKEGDTKPAPQPTKKARVA